jgi:hypothetical protein
VKAVATLLGISAFLAGAACKEAWTDAGYALRPDHGALDLLVAIWCLIVAWRLDVRLRKST